jgi:hypothetical protein
MEEIVASDCFFDVAHFRYIAKIKQIVDQYQGRAIIWYGSSGDGCFTRNTNHDFDDYYEVHDLHVGMAMGIWHQLGVNLFNCPTLSPYQSPDFLEKLFYKYNPYYVDKYNGDLRVMIGEKLHKDVVIYPDRNPEPEPHYSTDRARSRSVQKYIKNLASNNISVKRNRVTSVAIYLSEKIVLFVNNNSLKRRTKLSFILFPIRRFLSIYVPFINMKRYKLKEI